MTLKPRPQAVTSTLEPRRGIYQCRGYGCDFTDAELDLAGWDGRQCKLGERCLATKKAT